MENHGSQNTHERTGHYKKLLIMTALSFIAMFVLMYAMVDTFANVVVNVNQFYMAGLMASPMLIIELLVMGAMYKNKKLNTVFIAGGTIGLVVFFLLIRYQVGVGDKQFLKSMIPHHAAAILMVKETPVSDPEIKKLADDIIMAQQAEIEFMKKKIKELEN